MAARRERIDRRLSATAPIVLGQPANTIVVFATAGARSQSATISAGSVCRVTSQCFWPTLSVIIMPHRAGTRSVIADGAARVRALRGQDGPVVSVDHLSSAMVGRYIVWLDRQVAGREPALVERFAANVLMQLRQMIDWTKRRHPSRLPERIDFPWRVWPNRNADTRPRLGGGDLKAILRACYEDIDEAWDRFETGRNILCQRMDPSMASIPNFAN